MIFAAVLALTAVFVFSLFDLRADKIFSLPATAEEATAEDFLAYWRAGEMARGGEAALAYDAEAFRAELPPPNDHQLWLHPPHFLLVAAPLSLMPLPALKAMMIFFSIASLLLCARIASPRALFYVAAILSPGAFASALVMQLGPMIAAGLAAALVIAERRPVVAGLILALLTMKPQYGLMAPAFLIAIGAWRAFAAAAIGSLVLAALSILTFGAEPWLAFFHSAASGAIADHASILHRDMVSAQESLAKLGVGAGLRAGAQFALIAVGAIAVYFAARRWPREAAIGFALLVSALVSPSLWVYDWPLVAAALFLLARASSPWPVHLQLFAGALWMAPLISLGFTTMQSSLAAPVIFTGAVIGFWLWGERLPVKAPLAAP